MKTNCQIQISPKGIQNKSEQSIEQKSMFLKLKEIFETGTTIKIKDNTDFVDYVFDEVKQARIFMSRPDFYCCMDRVSTDETRYKNSIYHFKNRDKKYVCFFTQYLLPQQYTDQSWQPFQQKQSIERNLRCLKEFLCKLTAPSSENRQQPEAEVVFAGTANYLNMFSPSFKSNLKSQMYDAQDKNKSLAYFIVKRTNHQNYYRMRAADMVQQQRTRAQTMDDELKNFIRDKNAPPNSDVVRQDIALYTSQQISKKLNQSNIDKSKLDNSKNERNPKESPGDMTSYQVIRDNPKNILPVDHNDSEISSLCPTPFKKQKIESITNDNDYQSQLQNYNDQNKNVVEENYQVELKQYYQLLVQNNNNINKHVKKEILRLEKFKNVNDMKNGDQISFQPKPQIEQTSVKIENIKEVISKETETKATYHTSSDNKENFHTNYPITEKLSFSTPSMAPKRSVMEMTRDDSQMLELLELHYGQNDVFYLD